MLPGSEERASWAGATANESKAAADAFSPRLPRFLIIENMGSPEGFKHYLEYRT